MQLPVIGKVRWSLSLALGLLTIGLIGAGASLYLPQYRRSQEPDLEALTVPVQTNAVSISIEASGTVEPIQAVNLSPRSSNILAELHVEQGDYVEQGQLIAKMKADDIEAELIQAQARVAQAQARLDRLQNGNRVQDIRQSQARVAQAEARVADANSRLALAQERVSRNRYLTERGALSQDELDAVIQEVESARAALELDRANLEESNQNLELVQQGSRAEDIAEAAAQLQEAIGHQKLVEVRLADTLVRAPFDGVITQKFATVGAFVTPTTSASAVSSATSSAIVEVAKGLEIVAEISEIDVSQIQVGQQVKIIADTYPNQTYAGRVKLVAPEAIVQQNVTLFQVKVELITGLAQLKSGMNVDVEFMGEQSRSASVVPAVAVVTRNGETGVLVPDSRQRPRFRPVILGLTVGNQIEVLEGLKAGERIFVKIPPDQDLEKLEPEARTES